MLTKQPQGAKKHYDSKVKSSVLQLGDRVLIRNMTPRGGPGKLRNHWEDVVHTVVRQVNNDIPVCELRPEKGKGRSRTMHRNLLLPCDHLSLERSLRPRTKKSTVEIADELEEPEEEEDDEEYYPVSTQLQLQPCQPQPSKPVTTDEAAEQMQLGENASPESEAQPPHLPEQEDSYVENQSEYLPEQEDSCDEHTCEKETVPSLVTREHSSGQESQRPRRQLRQPKLFTSDQLGSPACYNMRILPKHTNFDVPWTHIVQPYHYQQPYGRGW